VPITAEQELDYPQPRIKRNGAFYGISSSLDAAFFLRKMRLMRASPPHKITSPRDAAKRLGDLAAMWRERAASAISRN
jgi:hypothetical protein